MTKQIRVSSEKVCKTAYVCTKTLWACKGKHTYNATINCLYRQMLTFNPTVILSSAISFFPAFKLMGIRTLKLDSEPLPYALPEEDIYYKCNDRAN
jgi:hypothetical protein